MAIWEVVCFPIFNENLDVLLEYFIIGTGMPGMYGTVVPQL